MKAMQIKNYGPASELTLNDIAMPSIEANQLLIEVGASGVNPVDTYIRSGTNNYKTTFPHTPGNDGAGTVVEVGADITEFKVGQRVYFSRNLTGSAAQYAVCLPTHTFPLADTLSFEEGACLGIPFTTAHRALFGRAKAQTGHKVFIHGATGAVGTACVQLALLNGMEVVASAGTPAGAELLRHLGVSHIVMHNEKGYLEPYQNVENGFDVIIEMLANHNLAEDLKALAFGGCVAIVGNRGTVEINPRDLMSRDASIVGVALANVTPETIKLIASSMQMHFASGQLKPIIRKTYPLNDLSQAHEDVIQPGALGNLVIKVK